MLDLGITRLLMAGEQGLSVSRGLDRGLPGVRGPQHPCYLLELSGTQPWALGGGGRGQTGAPGPHPFWESPLGQAHGEGRLSGGTPRARSL